MSQLYLKMLKPTMTTLASFLLFLLHTSVLVHGQFVVSCEYANVMDVPQICYGEWFGQVWNTRCDSHGRYHAPLVAGRTSPRIEACRNCNCLRPL